MYEAFLSDVCNRCLVGRNTLHQMQHVLISCYFNGGHYPSRSIKHKNIFESSNCAILEFNKKYSRNGRQIRQINATTYDAIYYYMILKDEVEGSGCVHGKAIVNFRHLKLLVDISLLIILPGKLNSLIHMDTTYFPS